MAQSAFRQAAVQAGEDRTGVRGGAWLQSPQVGDVTVPGACATGAGVPWAPPSCAPPHLAPAALEGPAPFSSSGHTWGRTCGQDSGVALGEEALGLSRKGAVEGAFAGRPGAVDAERGEWVRWRGALRGPCWCW